MTIYIDSEFKCYTTNPDGIYTEVETDFFNGKCAAFVEGYRFVPAGETWIREDGKVFRGEMITSWKDYNVLKAAQEQYERDQDELVASYLEGVNSV